MDNFILVNFDKNQYVTPYAFGEESSAKSILGSYQGILTAMCVLLSDGNGRGGGDLHSKHPLVGTWAGDRVGLVDDTVVAMDAIGGIPPSERIQDYLLKQGADISQQVLEAINEAERSYWVPGSLNVKMALPLTVQRTILDRYNALTQDRDAPNGPFYTITSRGQLFALLNQSTPHTAPAAVKKFNEGTSWLQRTLGVEPRGTCIAAKITDKSISLEIESRDKIKQILNFDFTSKENISATIFYQWLFPGFTVFGPVKLPGSAKLIGMIEAELKNKGE